MSDLLDFDDGPATPTPAPEPVETAFLVVVDERIEPNPPALPEAKGGVILLDASFMKALKALKKDAAALIVKDVASATLAGSYQQRLVNAEKAVDASRVKAKNPFRFWAEKIEAAAKGLLSGITEDKKSLQTKIIAYNTEVQRIAAETEQRRQVEIARLKKIADAEAAAAAAKAKAEADRIAAEIKKRDDEAAAEAARKKKEEDDAAAAALAKGQPPPKKAEELDFDELIPEPPPEVITPPPAPPVKTDTQIALEKLVHQAPAAPVKIAGFRILRTLTAKVVDVMLLPEVFVERTAKMVDIRKTYCTGWKEGHPIPTLPGVEFSVEESAPATKAPLI